ncbi:helix-turn-helix domain-containing protein [Sphingomonas sp. TX0543]|uniref:helix-turn-helix domain-containing protein n=1 Tax=unclassified Sphingomonas TaxID=196159 RepID=UPI0010F52E84|nr:helix-turn-helix transcriptional regulator [Sphingomonas sp. 3P27F8]
MSHDPRLPFQRRTLPAGVGTALRSAREARGETRAAVADAVGIRPRTLARIEREAQKPSWQTLDGLCDHLGVSVVALARRWMRDSLDVPSNPSSSPGLGLRALRRSRGMTLVELASLSGVSAATISRFERGLTASRLLGRRVRGEGLDLDARDVELDGDRLADAFGFTDAGSLWKACLTAFDAQE